ncbi:MAG: rhomboid family intramembrane serine protease, partial [Candidatus Promineifilaceae bacterium]|nr:rhomboid family intramembrane serine protease [Candidatus Promineifilaceae bacterium]
TGRQTRSVSQRLRSQLLILGGFVVLIWFLELLDLLFFQGALDELGVQPRSTVGLRGVLLMPFLHRGFGHLLANTLPFLVLGWLVMVRRLADFFLVTIVALLTSGLGVWLFGGSQSVHIGASGLVFGYFGYLILRAYFERSVASILVAGVVILLYGGLIWGVIPLQAGVSWQGHLFGFVGGALAAWLLSQRQP